MDEIKLQNRESGRTVPAPIRSRKGVSFSGRYVKNRVKRVFLKELCYQLYRFLLKLFK